MVALVVLQVSFAGIGLALSLPAYGLIAVAALLAFSSLRLPSKVDLFCVCTTGLFFGCIALRALTSPVSYSAREDLYLVLAAVVLYTLCITALSSPGQRFALIVSLLAFAMAHVVVGLIQAGLGSNFMTNPFLENLVVGTRANGFYANPDHLAGLLELLGILGLSITCWSRWPKSAKVLVGYLTFVCYVGVALTGSRGGYLSVAASLIVFGVLSLMVLRSGGAVFLWKNGAIGLVVIFVALLAAGHSALQSKRLTERATSILTPDNTRFDLSRAAIEQWKLQPLTGTGSGTYRFYGRQFRAERMQADPVVVHNDYLHLLCEYGAIGAMAFLGFLFAHLRHGWRTFLFFGPKRLAAGTLASSNRLALNMGALSAVSAYLVHSVVDFNLHIPANALLVAFVFAILAAPGMPAVPKPMPSRSKFNLLFRVATPALAAVLLIQCVRLWPGEYYTNRASAALEDEDPATAVALANKALTYEQQNPNIFFYLGRAFGALGNDKRQSEKRTSYYNAALAAFDKARLLAPLDGFYPLDMAFLYDEMGRFAEAEWMYGLARSRDPRSVMMSQLYKSHLAAWENEGQKDVPGGQ